MVDRLGGVDVAAPRVVERAVLQRRLEDQQLGAAGEVDDHLRGAHVAGVDDALAARPGDVHRPGRHVVADGVGHDHEAADLDPQVRSRTR